jgi:hypothetical protein
MGIMKDILKGQKLFFSDIFALINLVVLFFAYILGVGTSRIFLRNKGKDQISKSRWSVSDLAKKEKTSFLKQF